MHLPPPPPLPLNLYRISNSPDLGLYSPGPISSASLLHVSMVTGFSAVLERSPTAAKAKCGDVKCRSTPVQKVILRTVLHNCLSVKYINITLCFLIPDFEQVPVIWIRPEFRYEKSDVPYTRTATSFSSLG